jgi:molybdopterin-guanine dinucleotide biosynthesis protein A
MDIACAIMAGGKNTRMNGINKAFIKVDNVPIIQRTICTLKELFNEIFLVTSDMGDFKIYGKDVFIISDIIKGIGPLAGIHAALSHTTKEAVFSVACDMPFLNVDVIRGIILQFSKTQCDAVIPRIGKYIEPLHAIYQSKLKNNIQVYVKNSINYSIRGLLETVNVHYWDVDDTPYYHKAFININNPKDIQEVNRNLVY